MKVHVTAPASASNLGPGFDVLGLALDLVNEVSAESRDGAAITIELPADAAPALTDPNNNMVVRGYMLACDRIGVPREARGVNLVCTNRIPLARGLGSSAAAALSGVLAATRLHGAPWSAADILATTVELEGHPDNATASLLGGLVICAAGMAPLRAVIRDDLRAVLFIPDFELRTATARGVVPQSFSRAEAIFNLGHCAALVHALANGQYHLLAAAMDDQWHQPQRAALFPALPTLINAAVAAGARGACLSGAGPTVLALADQHHNAIADAMNNAAAAEGVSGTTLVCGIRADGAHAEAD